MRRSWGSRWRCRDGASCRRGVNDGRDGGRLGHGRRRGQRLNRHRHGLGSVRYRGGLRHRRCRRWRFGRWGCGSRGFTGRSSGGRGCGGWGFRRRLLSQQGRLVVASCESNQQQQKDCFHNDARSIEYKRILGLGCQHFHAGLMPGGYRDCSIHRLKQ
jgi:hypothetical protein